MQDFVDPPSSFAGLDIYLTTKHGKGDVIAPILAEVLGLRVKTLTLDTDKLGTFSGEIERKGDARDALIQKCQWAINTTHARLAMATEASFGPHPTNPLCALHVEQMAFVDNEQQSLVIESDSFLDTNYAMQPVSTWSELQAFAQTALFPSHALILCNGSSDHKTNIHKGIVDEVTLQQTYHSLIKSGPVWVETDMRAHLNPTRMTHIATLAERLAQRLLRPCPQCHTPGWGQVSIDLGLACEYCAAPTTAIRCNINGCGKCDYTEEVAPEHGLSHAPMAICPICNP